MCHCVVLAVCSISRTLVVPVRIIPPCVSRRRSSWICVWSLVIRIKTLVGLIAAGTIIFLLKISSARINQATIAATAKAVAIATVKPASAATGKAAAIATSIAAAAASPPAELAISWVLVSIELITAAERSNYYCRTDHWPPVALAEPVEAEGTQVCWPKLWLKLGRAFSSILQLVSVGKLVRCWLFGPQNVTEELFRCKTFIISFKTD